MSIFYNTINGEIGDISQSTDKSTDKHHSSGSHCTRDTARIQQHLDFVCKTLKDKNPKTIRSGH